MPSPDEAHLTRREWLGTICFGLALAGGTGAVAFWTGRRAKTSLSPIELDRPRRLIPFQLTERSGRKVTEADLAGKILVVDFVFTGCSLSCRAVNNSMEEIQRLTDGAKDVQLISLTVDPRSDTPAVLTAFANGYHADSNRWLFLTGDKRQLYGLIETSFIPKSPELEHLIPGGFAATDRIMLVDPLGNVHASFDGLKRDAAKTVVSGIENLRSRIRVK
ncbi:MAG: SCO family protein [Verrucomicrobiota bacterium]